MKSRKAIVIACVVLIAAAAVWLNRGKVHFDRAAFVAGLRGVAWWHIGAGIGLIYTTYLLRAQRWSVFLSPQKKVSALRLVGPQFIGFTAVALFGRLADLTRPYLVARRAEMPLAS